MEYTRVKIQTKKSLRRIEKYDDRYSKIKQRYLAIKKNLRNSIKIWEEVDKQLIMMKLNNNCHCIMIIGVFAPSYDANQQTNDEFDTKLFNTPSNIHARNEISILGPE